MATPTAEGRMLKKTISDSEGFASLSPESAVLFTMLIPWFNAHGKLNGGAGYIKDEICPKIPYLTYENIPSLLSEISQKTSVKYFKINGRCWIHSLHFNTKHQKLTNLGKDSLPSFSAEHEITEFFTGSEQVRNQLGTSENQVPLEIEREIEIEAEGKSGTEKPVDNSKPEQAPSENALIKKQFQEETELDELRGLVNQIQTKFPCLAILDFLRRHNRDHPQAVIHSLKSLLNHEIKIPEPLILMKYLETTIQAESKNYNARDSENQCNAFKADQTPLSALAGIVKSMPATAM